MAFRLRVGVAITLEEFAAAKPRWTPRVADTLDEALWWAMKVNDNGREIAWEIESDDGSRLDRQEIDETVWRRRPGLIANPPKKY
jgi:ABC-type nitrate/sulfonate/bicarbonate transport system substrate-binding protein